ncbi:MAG: hypothetical protein A7315_08860 [Candidatus Altiarchaeales archaeon WOR_SM1_79]|nr:MAG: hypothetical protein A7315_08860 [Candidatus Altiarchaeales archaeon WOR_SM1_79]
MESKNLDDIIWELAEFHGSMPPGLVIGAYMVDYARELLGETKGKLNAVAETRHCLIDAIQVMTPCTMGNKYLWLVDYGRFALTLYDRDTKQGIRVYIDMKKIPGENYPELYAFLLRKRDPEILNDMRLREISNAKVIDEVNRAKRDILSYQKVEVKFPRKPEMLPSIVCRKCSEPFLSDGAGICTACDSKGYYTQLK